MQDIQTLFLDKIERFSKGRVSELESLSAQILAQGLQNQGSFAVRFAKAIRKHFQKQVSI